MTHRIKLIPETSLENLDESWRSRIPRLYDSWATELDAPVHGKALGWHLLFTHGLEHILEHGAEDQQFQKLIRKMTAVEKFYNRYFWFRRFAALREQQHGADAGNDQQAMQILERAEATIGGIDWDCIEELDTMAQQ